MNFPKALEPYKSILEEGKKPIVKINFKVGDTLPWESKLGGCPYLEKAEDYPLDESGEPMVFLAQINLSEMPPLEDYPTEGILQFYYGNDGCYGLESPCKVIYIEKYSTNADELLSENPYQDNFEAVEDYPFEHSGKMLFTKSEMYPTMEKLEELCDVDLYDELDDDDFDEAEEYLSEEFSMVGGYPFFVQGATECYEDGTADVLLLQLDVDDNDGTELMFGDSGNCQFFISKEDLLNKDFSNVQYDWACC